MQVSIFIPTKNAGPKFQKTLENIFLQLYKNFEVIILDSGSTDKTLSIIKKFKTHLYKIKPNEFGHGKTRNLALKLARGEYIVYLSQDALPANQFWLSNLIKSLKYNKIAGSFSRQIPKNNSKTTEKFFYQYHFPEKKIIRPTKKINIPIHSTFFSNVSSCIKKKILKKYNFNEKLLMCEDQQWSQDVIKAGFKTAYEPSSVVIHSHNYSLKKTFQRYFDSAISLSEIINKNFRIFRKIGLTYMKKEFNYIIKNELTLLPYLTAQNASKILGALLGFYQEKIPIILKKRFSMHSYYWQIK